MRHARRKLRRLTALVSAPVVAATSLTGVAFTVAAAAGMTAASVAVAKSPAKAASGSVLILQTSVNGGASSAEAKAVPSSYTVTVATPSTWDAMTTAQFKSYSAIIIGDPSSGGTCASTVPSDALSTAAKWGPAVTGNVAVLGTAPALAGSSGSALLSDAVNYVLAGSGTGLYVSLNCEYSTASAGTSVPLLANVDGGGFTVTGQGSTCSNSGTVNTWEADALAQFNGLKSDALASWASPTCSVQETFTSWPAALDSLAYDTAASPATFTASDGATGQAYVLTGNPASTATQALAPAMGGVVPAGTMAGGSNPAAPGVYQAFAGDPVNTENGDFTQPSTDLSIPTFGPSLDFTRTYDAQAARQQTVSGSPGAMGYGWTDNWASSLATGKPVPGDIYTLSASATGLAQPAGVASDGQGDVFIADNNHCRVEEIAASSHTQYGIAMTAGHMYTVAGNGTCGISGDGGKATSAELNSPQGVAVDTAGNLYIADFGNNRVQEVSAATGNISTAAGSATGTAGTSGDGGPAGSARLNAPYAIAIDGHGNIYIDDAGNNRVQEIAAASGAQRGQQMTAGDIYTVAGSAAGTQGYSGIGGPATSALLTSPQGIAVDPAGNLYLADLTDNVVLEIAAATKTQWGQQMTANHLYDVAANPNAQPGLGGDGGPATAAQLDGADGVAVDSAGNLYIADTYNDRIQEVPAANGTQWGQQMTSGYMYTVAGIPSGAYGYSGDGGPATSAKLAYPPTLGVDANGDLFIVDQANNLLREVISAAGSPFPVTPAGGGITVSQANGSQVTFYPQSGGNCTAPYVKAGGYCALPQDINATLSYNSGNQTYTFSPSPGWSYTYASNGVLTGESDAAGETLTITRSSPSPGSGNCPATAFSCFTITSASGRALVTGINSAGLVTSVTDPLGRTWTYGYTGSDLTSATDPMGNKTTYTYGAGSTGNLALANDLLTITDPNAQPGGPDAGKSTVNTYNAAGQVTTQTDPMGFTTTFDYTGLNPTTGNGVVRVTDANGNATVDDYLQGTLIAASNWTGSTLNSEQDSGPVMTAGSATGGTMLDAWTADGNAKITTFGYDSSGNMVSAADPLGHATTFWSTALALKQQACQAVPTATSPCSSNQTGPTPVAPGSLIPSPSSAPPAGVTYNLFDTSGKELYSTTGVYNPGSSTASSVNTDYTLYKGNSVTLNGNNITCAATPPSPSLPCATVGPSGVVTQLSYDVYGDLASISVPDGNGAEMATTTFSYDADGEQTNTTSADGNLPGANAGNYTTVTAYNPDGLVTSTTTAGGAGATVSPRTTSYAYDANGNQTTVKDPRGYTTTTSYDADDAPALVTDPLGNATLTCTDAAGNVTQTVPPAGVAANSLTPASCPSSYPAGYGQRLAADATSYTYDANGHTTQVTTPAPAGQSGYETTTYAYDGAGNQIKTTAPPAAVNGPSQITTGTYDAAGQLTSETTGYGTSAASTTAYCYDPNGNQTAVIPPDGNIAGVAPCETSSPWVVNSSSYPTQAAYQTTYTYDSADEIASVSRPATSSAPGGATTSFTYNASGEMLTATDPNGVTAAFTYTPRQLVASASFSGSAAHSVSYTRDAQGQLTGMVDATGSSSYSHDPFGELSSATNGAGQTVAYGYDADGNTASVTYPLPSTATWAASNSVTYGYDKADNLASVTDFNGNTTTVGYTADGLPNSMTLGTTGDVLTTSYDPTDSPSAISLKNNSSTLLGFSYSDGPSGDILSETDTPSSSQSPSIYSYDGQGRLTSMTPGSGPPLSYGFDASGNLTTVPSGASATYDHASELTSSALNGTTTGYTYNADGERLTATQNSSTIASGTWNGAGELTAYTDPAAAMNTAVYDGAGLRASATFTPSGGSASNQSFVWDTQASTQLMDSANAYVYGTSTAPIEQVSLSTGKVTYLAADSLGSVRGIVSPSGSLVASTSYDAWGNPLTTGGLSSYTPFGYAGGYTDPTGLIYLLNRYYDPATGQFTSVDPAIDQTGQPYAYTGGNPVSESDPSGTAWLEEVACNCSFTGRNAELNFQLDMAAFLTIPAAFFHAHLLQQKRTAMTLCQRPLCPDLTLNFTRIPDIYWLAGHWGWINELKVGQQYWTGRNPTEATNDLALLGQHGGYGSTDHRNGSPYPGRWLPVNYDIWWFAPRNFVTVVSQELRDNLLSYGINVVIMYYKQNEPKWPRAQTKQQKEKETKEIESGNKGEVTQGLNSMIGPCYRPGIGFVCHR